MKKTLFLTATIVALIVVSPASAANPNASINMSSNKRFVNLNFSNLEGIKKVSYTLTYETGKRTTGFTGGFKPKLTQKQLLKKEILGTCSKKFCTYHKNPKNLNLDVTYYKYDGTKSRSTVTL